MICIKNVFNVQGTNDGFVVTPREVYDATIVLQRVDCMREVVGVLSPYRHAVQMDIPSIVDTSRR